MKILLWIFIYLIFCFVFGLFLCHFFNLNERRKIK